MWFVGVSVVVQWFLSGYYFFYFFYCIEYLILRKLFSRTFYLGGSARHSSLRAKDRKNNPGCRIRPLVQASHCSISPNNQWNLVKLPTVFPYRCLQLTSFTILRDVRFCGAQKRQKEKYILFSSTVRFARRLLTKTLQLSDLEG